MMFDPDSEVTIPLELLERLTRAGGPVVFRPLYGRDGAFWYHAATSADNTEVFEVTRAVSRTTGNVLELACGTGRLTLALAAMGRSVTALDSSKYMLEILGSRLTDRSCGLLDVTPVNADMASFRFPHKFGAVVIGATSIALLGSSERRRLYRSVAEHLDEDGMFVMTVPDSVYFGDGRVVETHVPSGDAREYMVVEHFHTKEGYRDVFMVVVGSDYRSPTAVYFSRIQLVGRSCIVDELAAEGFHVLSVEAVRQGTIGDRSCSVISARASNEDVRRR